MHVLLRDSVVDVDETEDSSAEVEHCTINAMVVARAPETSECFIRTVVRSVVTCWPFAAYRVLVLVVLDQLGLSQPAGWDALVPVRRVCRTVQKDRATGATHVNALVTIQVASRNGAWLTL